MAIGEEKLLFKHEVVDDTHNPPKLRISTYLGAALPITLAIQYPEGQVSVLGKVAKEMTRRTKYRDGRIEEEPFLTSPLITLVLPETLELVEFQALKNCDSLRIVNFLACRQMKLGAEAFVGCRSLSSVFLPKHLTTIGERTFSRCQALSHVTFSSDLDYIGSFAFESCHKLRLLKGLPDTLTHMGVEVFAGCKSIEQISIPLGVTELSEGLFRNCSNLKSITLHSEISGIGAECFTGCESLEEIILPEGLVSIGENAFYGCKKITSIEIPSSVIQIGRNAFPHGVMPQKPQCIQHMATDFYKENSVLYASRWIQGLEDLDELQRESLCEEFRKNPRVVADVMLTDEATLQAIIIKYQLLNYKAAGLLCEVYKENYEFASIFANYRGQLEELGFEEEEDPFADMTLFELSLSFDYQIKKDGLILENYHGAESSVFVPDRVDGFPVLEVRRLGKNNFVKSIAFAKGISSLGNGVCRGFEGLTEVILPAHLERICDNAFDRCVSLNSITIPESCTHIWNYAFVGCVNLQQVTLPEGLKTIGEGAFFECIGLKNIAIPKPCKEVGALAFYGCRDLEVSMEKTTLIGKDAFAVYETLSKEYKDYFDMMKSWFI